MGSPLGSTEGAFCIWYRYWQYAYVSVHCMDKASTFAGHFGIDDHDNSRN